MSHRAEEILKVMTGMNLDKEQAIDLLDKIKADPVRFEKHQKLIAELRSKPDTTRKLKGIQLRRTKKPIGRNDPCPCGSGKKFKHCECFKADRTIGVIVHREKPSETPDATK